MASVVDCDVSTPFGTTDENSTQVFQAEWSRLWQAATGDGIVGETTTDETGRWAITASGSDTNVTITPNGAPGVIVSGFSGRLTSAKSLDIDEDGAPGSGVRRLDWIVARLNRSDQKVQLAVVQGDPGTGVLPTLETDRGGDTEVPLAYVDRTGPVNVTQAMITVVSMRPAPGFFLGVAGGATVRNAIGAPIGALLIQGHTIYSRILSGGVMAWRDLGKPTWTNLTLPSGYSAVSGATPQYRVLGDEFQCRGIIQRSGSSWSNGATIASFPVTVRDLLPDANSIWHRHAAVTLYPSNSASGVSVVTPVRVQLNDSGGTLTLPNAAGANSSLNRVDLASVGVRP